ncbi:hypothetical protein EYC84_004710 [Monilinia fructicola]|uniref:HMG box domain-containing protein n=1 Tax=Monilinia fructicola TaxID=38448 RepID=A0A5M9K218_MONFR|nr:hypothetical protein EYC84_004710 [Monilinia fructicola]
MARPKKNTEEKPKDAATTKAAAAATTTTAAAAAATAGGDGATLQIDVASFVRTRDTFIGGLATLQEAIQSVSSAYIKHTNAVLGEHGAGYDIDTALSKLGENPLLGSLGALQRAASPVVIKAVDQAPEKKERKKRQHDPNAPKRPLTPFFLYMQTARPIIAKDLGDVPKGEVSSEGTKRWTDMAPKDKALWQDAYKDNLRLYNARMHAYRRGNLTAKEMGDDAAAAYADEHNIGADASADAQLVGEASAGVTATVEEEEEDAEGEPEAEAEAEVEKIPTPEPAPKTPKAKGRKSKGKSDVTEEIPPPSSASIVPPQKEASPARKRKRSAKKAADEPVASTEQEETTIETPKSAPKASIITWISFFLFILFLSNALMDMDMGMVMVMDACGDSVYFDHSLSEYLTGTKMMLFLQGILFAGMVCLLMRRSGNE